MPDLSFDPRDVLSTAEATQTNTAGEDVAAGDVLTLVVIDSTHDQVVLATSTDQDLSVVYGIALNNAAPGQPVDSINVEEITFGIDLDVGMTLVLSDTPGKIKPIEELSMYEYLSYIGYVETYRDVKLNVLSTGVQKQY